MNRLARRVGTADPTREQLAEISPDAGDLAEQLARVDTNPDRAGHRGPRCLRATAARYAS